MIDHYENRMDITLVGSGFLGCYYFGAFSLLTQVWPNHPFSKLRGCSSGGIMAASAASGLSLTRIAAQFGKFTIKAKQLMRRLGLGGSMTHLVRVMLADLLPDNAHKLASGRIDINLTRVCDFANVKASNFETKQILLDALIAGCFIPFWSGTIIPPVYKGTRYIDGGWAYKSQPVAADTKMTANGTGRAREDDAVTLTGCPHEPGDIKMIFSPFSGKNMNVCPEDSQSSFGLSVWCFGVEMNVNWANFVRMFNSFIPRHSSVYEQYIVAGHNDMKRCLINNYKNLLKCEQCHENNSAIGACLRCMLLVERVDNLRLPRELLEAYHSTASGK